MPLSFLIIGFFIFRDPFAKTSYVSDIKKRWLLPFKLCDQGAPPYPSHLINIISHLKVGDVQGDAMTQDTPDGLIVSAVRPFAGKAEEQKEATQEFTFHL